MLKLHVYVGVALARECVVYARATGDAQHTTPLNLLDLVPDFFSDQDFEQYLFPNGTNSGWSVRGQDEFIKRLMQTPELQSYFTHSEPLSHKVGWVISGSNLFVMVMFDAMHMTAEHAYATNTLDAKRSQMFLDTTDLIAHAIATSFDPIALALASRALYLDYLTVVGMTCFGALGSGSFDVIIGLALNCAGVCGARVSHARGAKFGTGDARRSLVRATWWL